MAVHLKIDDDDLDVEELDVEYDDGPRYSGPIPPEGTVLNGRVEKMWWTYAGDGTAMIKLIAVADETAGPYEGLTCWENLVLKPTAAFKYQPFLQFFGLTLADVKAKTYVAEEDDPKNGAPIEKIAKWKPGTDAAMCAFVIGHDVYEGKLKPQVTEWLEYDEDREPPEVEDDEEEEVARPRGAKAASKKPAARTVAKTPARGRRNPEPEPEEEEEEEESEEEPEEEEEATPARGRRKAPARTASKAAPAKAPAKAAGGRRPAARKPARGSSEDPPF